MGSITSMCSIVNDTSSDVLVMHGINWHIFICVLDLLLSALPEGPEDEFPEDEVPARDGIPEQPRGARRPVTNVFKKLKHMIETEAKELRDQMPAAELIKPGEKYTWSGTLSLHMRVYVINDKLQKDDRACFTGPWVRSEKFYHISKYFKKLDVM